MEHLQRERDQLQGEIQRYAQMRLNTNSFKPIMKLGILEVDMDIKDFHPKTLHREEPTATSRGEEKTYIGVIEAQLRHNWE